MGAARAGQREDDESPPEDFVSVKEIAAEMHMTERQAWELLKRLAVPCVGPLRNAMRLARFPRSAWVAARDGSLVPLKPRPSKGRKKVKAAAAAVPSTGLGSWKDYVPR